jgi:dTMP kinase
MFITFESGEGSGKSTQARRLAEALKAEGYDVVVTREPGGSLLAEELRSLVVQGEPGRMDALTELLLFTAARRDHIHKVIQPALDRGAIVICDRYVGSTHALQGAGGTPADLIDMLHSSFCHLDPDLTIFLEMDCQTSLKRAMDRMGSSVNADSRFEAKGTAFHKEVDRIFRAQCAEHEEWQSVPATGSIEDVAARVIATVKSHPKFLEMTRVRAA